MVGPTAATEHGEAGLQPLQFPILETECYGVADVELCRDVELGMAAL